MLYPIDFSKPSALICLKSIYINLLLSIMSPKLLLLNQSNLYSSYKPFTDFIFPIIDSETRSSVPVLIEIIGYCSNGCTQYTIGGLMIVGAPRVQNEPILAVPTKIPSRNGSVAHGANVGVYIDGGCLYHLHNGVATDRIHWSKDHICRTAWCTPKHGLGASAGLKASGC